MARNFGRSGACCGHGKFLPSFAQAIDTTALNPSGIGTFSDPPTQAEMQSFAAHVETLRVALVR